MNSNDMEERKQLLEELYKIQEEKNVLERDFKAVNFVTKKQVADYLGMCVNKFNDLMQENPEWSPKVTEDVQKEKRLKYSISTIEEMILESKCQYIGLLD